MGDGLRQWLGAVSIPTFVFVCLFAISSWIDINGIWVEIPLLVNELPESWNLPSYLVIIIQFANVGPLAYTIARKIAPNHVNEPPVIYLIISIGAASCALLAFFWNYTTYVGGSEHSTALLTLSAFLALVDCTSSVVYLPYMGAFPPQYLTAFYVGEGLSGLLPALVGLAQGVGRDPICVNETVRAATAENGSTPGPDGYQVVAYYEPPLFSVSVYFWILFALICVSAISFTVVHFHPHCRRQRLDGDSRGLRLSSDGGYDPSDVRFDSGVELRRVKAIVADVATRPADWESMEKVGMPDDVVLAKTLPSEKKLSVEDRSSQSSLRHSNSKIASIGVILLLVGWSNALTNGVLPSLQSYSCLPYGNLAYNLSVKLSVAANPITCFLALFIRAKSTVTLVVLTALGSILSGYQIALAALSPNPPLKDSDVGVALVIATFVLLTAFFSYVKVCAADRLNDFSGPSGLLWCGVVTQIGSLVGAVVTFLLVNVFKLFTSAYPCT